MTLRSITCTSPMYPYVRTTGGRAADTASLFTVTSHDNVKI